MKMNKLTVAALALAAISFASTAASAQTVSAGLNDLILGFQLPSGSSQQGASTDLEVDLGSFTNFTASTQTITLPQLALADLTSTYGSSWATTVDWSVAGNNTSSGFDMTSTQLVKTSSQGGLSGAVSAIGGLIAGLNGQPATANSSSAALIGGSPAASSIGNSYTSEEAGNGYGFVPTAEQTGAGSDELYSFTPQSQTGTGVHKTFPNAIDLGTFSLSSAGVLTFTGSAAAVPEPSAYALGICAALLFLVLRRRSTVA
jgi:hypothetical protein